MPSNIEIIRKTEAEIPKIEAQVKAVRKKAMADDKITAEERTEIERVENKLRDLTKIANDTKAIWEKNKADFQSMRDTIDQNFGVISPNEYTYLDKDYAVIAAYETKLSGPVGEEDYAKALKIGDKLQQAVLELMAKRDALEKEREQYEYNLGAQQERLDKFNSSTPELAYVDPQISKLATETAEMEKAATAGNFEKANTQLVTAIDLLDEIDAEIEKKKVAYETDRKAFDTAMEAVGSTSYFDLAADYTALTALRTDMQSCADSEDWNGALDACTEATKAQTEYAKVVKKQEEIRTTLQRELTSLESKLSSYSSSTSSVKNGADKNITKIKDAVAGTGSLEAAKGVPATVKAQLEEMAVLEDALTKLNAADPADLDDVSKDIIDQLKSDGKLDKMPTELRTQLLSNLKDGTPTADEHAAIKEILSLPHIDRQFEEVDKGIRENIIKAYMSDPKVKELSTKWEKMPEPDRVKELEELIKVPSGKDGWDIGLPANITDFSTAFTPGNKLFGWYDSTSDTMAFNTHNDACKDFGETLDTITHEIGHKRQADIVKRLDLDPSDPKAIKKGDPEYEQAMWLKTSGEYASQVYVAGEDNDPWDAVYLTSPEEHHSRTMGDEMKAGLSAGFNLPERPEREHDHAHGHGHSH